MKTLLISLLLFSMTTFALALDPDGFHQQIFDCMDNNEEDCREVCMNCHPSVGGIEIRADGGNPYCLDCHDDKAGSQTGTARGLHGNPGEHEAVPCISCHDPHVGTPGLLIMSNQGSELCLSCHDL